MKTLIQWLIVLIAFYCLLSCDDVARKTEERNHRRLKYSVIQGVDNDEFYVIKIDKCDYIVFQGSQKGGIVHKANCPNHK